MHLAMHLEEICNGKSSAYWGAWVDLSCIFNHNKTLQWRIAVKSYTTTLNFFWVLPKVSGRSVPYLSHFYTSRTQRTRVNRNKHEQNHNLVTNIMLWPPIVPHCILISKFDTTCTSTIRSPRTRIRSKRCPLKIIVINEPSIKLVERLL